MEQWIDMAKLWKSMPKVELHAHLEGSIRDLLLGSLVCHRNFHEIELQDYEKVEHILMKEDRDLSDVDKLFDIINILTSDLDNIKTITKEAVEAFATDNVVYLELRVTPKDYAIKGINKRMYMDAVLRGLRLVDETLTGGKKICVNLILCIDRKEDGDAAMQTVKLARDLRRWVVGIDLYGDPCLGDWNKFLPALRFARSCGLHVTLHCGNRNVPNSKEIHDMLDFLPNRIAHTCGFEEDHWRKLKSSKIPVEICLTSDVKTGSVPSIDVHPFLDLYAVKHPVALCSDLPNMFDTSLSKEYGIVASKFAKYGITTSKAFELSKNAIEFTFADEAVKEEIRKIFNSVAESWE